MVNSGVGVRLKVGDKYWEEWRDAVWGGAVPSPVGGLGLTPRKKNQFCTKNYAILSSFGTSFLYYSTRTYHRIRESGGLSPSPKSGGPIPLPPTAPPPMMVKQEMIMDDSTNVHFTKKHTHSCSKIYWIVIKSINWL